MDVLSGVEHLKTKLVEACKFDYYSIIFPAVQIYLTVSSVILILESFIPSSLDDSTYPFPPLVFLTGQTK